jgi:hypothetical protein
VNLTSCNFVFLTLIEEVTMTIQVFGPEATVSTLNRAFTDTSPANAIFNNQVTNAKSMGDQAFANAFAASWSGLSNAELSKKVLTNMGILPTTDTSVAALEQALTDYFAAFGSKVSGTNGQVTADTRGFIVLQLASILSNSETSTGNLAVYNAAAVAWNSEVASAYTYSSNTTNTTSTQSGSTGQSLTLTVNQDNSVGGTGDDTINSPVNIASNILKNTLQSVDTIDGGTGNDTLNVTLGEGGSITPSMKNVENVVVRFAATDTLNLSSSTGVTSITANNSSANGTVSDIGGATALSIKNQNSGKLLIDGVAGTATTMAFDFDTVGTKTGTTISTITLDLGVTAASKVTTANIKANNAYISVDSTQADVFTTAAITATGTNTLLFSDSKATLTKVTATGDGSVDLWNSGAVALAAVTTLDASALKGAIKAEITNAAKAVTITTGAGDDYIKAPTINTVGTSANLGAGNDTLIVGAKLAKFDKSNGGEGTDIINITDGATLTSTTAKTITGFETLDISGSVGGTFDLSLNNFPTVQVDEAVGGVLVTAATTLSNAPDSFALTLISKAKDADFTTGQTITVTGKDFQGTTATGDAETFTLIASLNDDNKDGVADGNIVSSGITVGTGDNVASRVENVVIQATATKIDGGTTTAANKTSAYTLKPVLTTYGTETITIKGDASIDFTGSTFTNVGGTYNVSKVDASASTGNIKLDLNSVGTINSVSYTGSAGVDTYTASAKGDMIYTGKGGDSVTLKAATIRDTLVFKAGTDSQLTDVSKDGKATLVGDGVGVTDTTVDLITDFKTAVVASAGGDRIDLTNFGFTNAQRGVEDVSSKVTTTTDLTSVTGFFNSVAGARGAAFAYTGTTEAYVFVDANKDGNFTAADDLVIKLAGVDNTKTLAEADFNF